MDIDKWRVKKFDDLVYPWGARQPGCDAPLWEDCNHKYCDDFLVWNAAIQYTTERGYL